MKATLAQIEAFYWISQLGSFRAGAHKLNLTQPTLSLRMRNLEQALGMRLFERSGRQMRLTHGGANLLPDVCRLMDLAKRLSAYNGSRDPLHGRIRIGVPESIAMCCITDLLGAMKKRSADLSVALTIDRTALLRQRLAQRELDLAFVVSPRDERMTEPHLRMLPLGRMTHAWVASPQLGLGGRWIEPKHLLPYQIFTHPEPSMLMSLIKGWFGSAGLEPQRVGTCNGVSVILRLISAGAGVSLLPPAILADELRTGRVELLKTRPKLVQQRLFVGYQSELIGPTLGTVLEIAQRVVKSSRLLAAS